MAIDFEQRFGDCSSISVDDIETAIIDDESISLAGHYTDFSFAVRRVEQEVYEQLYKLRKGDNSAIDELKALLKTATREEAKDFQTSFME